MKVLVLNAGSSSLKFKLMRVGAGEEVLAEGLVEKWGTPQAALRMSVAGKPSERRTVAAESSEQAARHAIEACRPIGIDALGHRVVHGGAKFEEPTLVSPQVIDEIKKVSHLAPLHNQLAVAGIEAGIALLPGTPAVAVFDTSFHRTMPSVASRYALPVEWAEQHELRRYGFHGISHKYISGLLLERVGRPKEGSRLISCHLGNGSSVCAIRDGKSIDTSMGLTPMEGLIMGTRSGDIDPGLVLHLMTNLKMTAEQVDDLLNRRSGLLGLSGRSGDMRDIEQAAQSGDVKARAAVESFACRVRKYIGAYAAAMGGVDFLAFTAGIGEHSPHVRSAICQGLEFLGIELDQTNNDDGSADARPISRPGSVVGVWVVPTDEERQIARETWSLLEADRHP
jgi:acetate kinase